MPKMPKFDEKPEVPEGGLGPAEFRRAPSLPGVPDAGSATEQMPDSSEVNFCSFILKYFCLCRQGTLKYQKQFL